MNNDWLEKMGVSIVKEQENSRQLLEKFIETARPSSVFAPPLTAGDYTVITASEVYAGMGVGFGGGGGSGPQMADEAPAEASEEAPSEPSTEEDAVPSGVGYGGGGGGVTMGRPVAAITIGPNGVEVEPIVDATKIAIALFTTVGAMALMFTRMSRASRK